MAAAEEIAEIGRVESERCGVKTGDAGGGFQNPPGVTGRVVKNRDIPGGIHGGQRSDIDYKLIYGGCADGKSASDIYQVPAGIGAFGRVHFIDLPGIMAAAVPGFVAAAESAGAAAWRESAGGDDRSAERSGATQRGA